MYRKRKTPLYASFDVETDGNNPMQNSMRSIGIALFVSGHAEPIDTFYRTVQPRADAAPEDKCMRSFWKEHPEAWQHVNEDPSPASDVMTALSLWLKSYSTKYTIKWVASPANFDWMFLKCYYESYAMDTDKYDIGFFCHDFASLVRAYMLMQNISDAQKFKDYLAGGAVYTHHALDDAIYQGISYMNLRTLLQFRGEEGIEMNSSLSSSLPVKAGSCTKACKKPPRHVLKKRKNSNLHWNS